jgi:hypothetical protein
MKKKALIPIGLFFLSSCCKDNSFTPNYNSPSIPAPQITNFTFQGSTVQFTDQTWVYWTGDTLHFQTSNGQNTVLTWFIIDSLKDTTYNFDPFHARITLYNFQGAEISSSLGVITASFGYQPNAQSNGSVQGTMQTDAPGSGNACVSYSNIGIPMNTN